MKTDRSFFDWTLPLVKSELPISPLLRTTKCQFVKKKTTDNPKYYRQHADILQTFDLLTAEKNFKTTKTVVMATTYSKLSLSKKNNIPFLVVYIIRQNGQFYTTAYHKQTLVAHTSIVRGFYLVTRRSIWFTRYSTGVYTKVLTGQNLIHSWQS